MNFISINPAEINTYNPFGRQNGVYTRPILFKFLEENPFHFYHLVDGKTYSIKLKIHAAPTNLFIDKEGYVRNIEMGFPLEKDDKNSKFTLDRIKVFEAIIEKLIKN